MPPKHIMHNRERALKERIAALETRIAQLERKVEAIIAIGRPSHSPLAPSSPAYPHVPATPGIGEPSYPRPTITCKN